VTTSLGQSTPLSVAKARATPPALVDPPADDEAAYVASEVDKEMQELGDYDIATALAEDDANAASCDESMGWKEVLLGERYDEDSGFQGPMADMGHDIDEDYEGYEAEGDDVDYEGYEALEGDDETEQDQEGNAKAVDQDIEKTLEAVLDEEDTLPDTFPDSVAAAAVPTARRSATALVSNQPARRVSFAAPSEARAQPPAPAPAKATAPAQPPAPAPAATPPQAAPQQLLRAKASMPPAQPPAPAPAATPPTAQRPHPRDASVPSPASSSGALPPASAGNGNGALLSAAAATAALPIAPEVTGLEIAVPLTEEPATAYSHRAEYMRFLRMARNPYGSY
jgi:hypothetical protein